MKLARVLPVLAAAGLAFGLCGPARADLDAYVATADGDFGWVDLTTGVYHRIGSLDLPSGDTISGMGFIGGVLVGGDSNFNAGSLYTINAATGAATQVGALNVGGTHRNRRHDRRPGFCRRDARRLIDDFPGVADGAS